ncbi:MAG: RidA family protein [Propioniciclava sp.]
MNISERLERLGITLPPVATPVAAYVPAVAVNGMVVTSGQLPVVDGELTCVGVVGQEVAPEEAHAAARTATLNALAAAGALVGGVDQIERIVKVVVYVASTPAFTGQPQVANGASLVLEEIFGDAGIHARSAVGVAALPLGAPVEIELTVTAATPV